MSGDFRDALADLLEWAESVTAGWVPGPAAVTRARALLAEAQPQPVEPTDEEITELMLMVSDYRRLNAVKFARAVLARWGRPAPEPVEPTDEQLDKTLFKALCDYMQQESPFGGPPDEKQLDRAKARAVLRRWGRPAPEPVQPTDEELSEFATDWWKGFSYPEQGADMATPVTDIIHPWHFVDFLRAALQRWGRPAPEPVSVAERLPTAADCDADGVCWWWSRDMTGWFFCFAADGDRSEWTHWLPHWALPVPQEQADG